MKPSHCLYWLNIEQGSYWSCCNQQGHALLFDFLALVDPRTVDAVLRGFSGAKLQNFEYKSQGTPSKSSLMETRSGSRWS